MPAKTEKQKKFFGAVMGAKKGQKNVSGEAKKVAKELPKKEIKKFLKKEDEEDEEKACWKNYKKQGTKMKGGKKVNNCVKENVETFNIRKFVEAILTKNYSSANNHLKQVVQNKLAKKIQSELNTPLF